MTGFLTVQNGFGVTANHGIEMVGSGIAVMTDHAGRCLVGSN